MSKVINGSVEGRQLTESDGEIKHAPRVLCVEDNCHDAELMADRLEAEGLQLDLTRVDTQPDFLRELEDNNYSMIVSDYTIPGFGGRDALIFARERRPEIPFIFFSGTIGEERAVECLKIGATDFVLKDHPTRLVAVIKRALDESALREAQKAATQALQMRDAQFAALVDQGIIGVYMIQGDSWMYVNSTLASIAGYTVEEMTGQPVANFVAPEFRGRVAENIRKRLAGEVSSVRYELSMQHKQGFPVYVEAHGSVTAYNGRPAIMGVLLDITERRRREEQIREQAALLDKAMNAILVMDLFRRVRYWNDGAHRLYGWAGAEMRGQSTDVMLAKDRVAEAEIAFQKVLEEGEWQGECKHVTKAGKEVIVESHWSLIRDETGTPKSIFIVNSDITEKKKIDAQNRRTQRMDSIGALAGGIAHDLNNVLSPVLLAMSLLRDEIPSESGRKLVDVVESSCRRGADMVKQILMFARGAEGERRVMKVDHTLNELVKILRQMFSKSVRLENHVAPGLWPVLGDATQLHQVFLNLCVNARDAMPEGGLVRIEATNITLDELEARMFGGGKSGMYVLITVADTGSGIPPEVMEKIFEPFFTTKEVGVGTGLGLSTVAGIIKSHDGFVKVYSEVGRGTSFRIYLPAAKASDPRADNAGSEEAPLGNGEKILLVDDEVAIREITKAALEKNGYEVFAAADGAEAIATYAQHRDNIAIVITDMTMPIMDGTATIRALQRIKPDIKIIAVSGLKMDLKATQVEVTPNIQFLAKPFDTGKLLVTLHKLLGKAGSLA